MRLPGQSLRLLFCGTLLLGLGLILALRLTLRCRGRFHGRPLVDGGFLALCRELHGGGRSIRGGRVRSGGGPGGALGSFSAFDSALGRKLRTLSALASPLAAFRRRRQQRLTFFEREALRFLVLGYFRVARLVGDVGTI